MSGQCTICISNLSDPVCIPCGHLYCSQCLSDYISSSSEDGYNSACPTCRAPFSFGSLTCLPKHVHRFITPSIRRVYLDTSGVQTLQEKLATSQTQITRLTQESERLMVFCEKYQNAAAVHAEGEAKANLEVERLTRLLRQQKSETAAARRSTSESTEAYDEMQKKLDELPEKSSRKRRKRASHTQDHSRVDDQSPDPIPSITPRRRVIRELPNRLQLISPPEKSSSRRVFVKRALSYDESSE
ncbi:hypothetical protein GYMLUDRAFT_76156 [Collybiopsis luxurians FD-317 M1]|uniref:RING-type domain-containing protein n=1 Tax=Collybiopsis luxurians FD-317 M1 TaxID=944289 RepID=A0A0D0CMI6_9AGAR|nr:hypothetical protein GYMLUDRAFT_76156 [Collybiopsis luxurians FD-317 M1]